MKPHTVTLHLYHIHHLLDSYKRIYIFLAIKYSVRIYDIISTGNEPQLKCLSAVVLFLKKKWSLLLFQLTSKFNWRYTKYFEHLNKMESKRTFIPFPTSFLPAAILLCTFLSPLYIKNTHTYIKHRILKPFIIYTTPMMMYGPQKAITLEWYNKKKWHV